MKFSEFACLSLDKHVRRYVANDDGRILPRGIVIVDGATEPREDYLCIVTRDGARTIAEMAECPRSWVFLANGVGDEGKTLLRLPGVSAFETDLECIALYNLLQDILTRAVGSSWFRGAPKLGEFDFFLQDVMEMRLKSDREILKAYLAFPTAAEIPYRVLMFQFDNPVSQAVMHGLASHLKQMFLRVNVSDRLERVIAIVQPPTWTEDTIELPEKQCEQLGQLCEDFSCRCAVCNPCLNWQVLKTEIDFARFTLRIAPYLDDVLDNRLYYVEDYVSYLLLDWSFDAYKREEGHDNYIYLLHPGIAQIIRYDQEHGTDMIRVLSAYMLNNCNTSQTADALYMHRNTVVYKIKRIRELFEIDLDNPRAHERVLFSCMLYRYCTQVRGITPEQFKGYGIKERFPILPSKKQ